MNAHQRPISLKDNSSAERDSRWHRIRTWMDGQRLDGLLVFGSDSPLAVVPTLTSPMTALASMLSSRAKGQ